MSQDETTPRDTDRPDPPKLKRPGKRARKGEWIANSPDALARIQAGIAKMQILRDRAPRCTATRSDGAPCRGAAVRGSDKCNKHGGGRATSRGKRSGKLNRIRLAERRAILARATPECRADPLYQTFARTRARGFLASLVLVWETYAETGDAVRFRQDRETLSRAWETAEREQDKRRRRWYREREALGIPHPEDPAKW